MAITILSPGWHSSPSSRSAISSLLLTDPIDTAKMQQYCCCSLGGAHIWIPHTNHDQASNSWQRTHSAISDLSCHTNFFFFFFFNVGRDKEAAEPESPIMPSWLVCALLCSLLPAWNTGLVFRCAMSCTMVLRPWRGKSSTKGDGAGVWWDPEVLIPLLPVVVKTTDPSTGMPVLKTKPQG